MDATESQIGGARAPGPTGGTADLLIELSGCSTDAAAIQLALRRAAEAVDAELCVFVDGDQLESAGSDATLAVPVGGRLRGHLVLARTGHSFDQAERERIESIAQALSLFDPTANDGLLERLAVRDELAAALRGQQIQAYFLPKVDLRSARVIGVEALARWLHLERGVLLPADFLGLAEAGELMPALTQRVTRLAIRAAADWWRSGLELEVTVNLPPDALTDPDPGLAKTVANALAATELPARALRFDVTEAALMRASDPATALEELTGLGASISIDDFGTGHTSLGRLESLGIDELKIDRSLIRALARGGDRALVRSTVHLARRLGLRVVAKGVDSDDAWRQLRGIGCDAAQGFLIGAPMPAREFLAWIASWDARARRLNTVPPGHLNPPKRRSRERSNAPDTAPA
ncbi:MAG TPA: EAL domain-containing protein [Solirubrobacterales bacterium]|nr:EAL domain-containing protein [Solirubrobacterales bacterium]